MKIVGFCLMAGRGVRPCPFAASAQQNGGASPARHQILQRARQVVSEHVGAAGRACRYRDVVTLSRCDTEARATIARAREETRRQEDRPAARRPGRPAAGLGQQHAVAARAPAGQERSMLPFRLVVGALPRDEPDALYRSRLIISLRGGSRPPPWTLREPAAGADHVDERTQRRRDLPVSGIVEEVSLVGWQPILEHADQLA